MMKLYRLRVAPIDIGIGVHDNFTAYKLSLIFVDVLLNLRQRSLLIGFGIPLVAAWALLIGSPRALGGLDHRP